MRRVFSWIRIAGGIAIAVVAGIAVPRVLAPVVHVSLNQAGLSSIKFRDVEYLSSGKFQLHAVAMRTPEGETISADVKGEAHPEPEQNAVTTAYSWGTVRVTYQASGNRFTVSVVIENRSPNTITGFFADPIVLHFPVKPRNYDNVTPILGANVGSLTALRVDYGTSSVVLCSDDVDKPLMFGLPFAYDKPASTTFPLRMVTSRDKTMPDSLPFVDRPIAPGASDTLRVSLRFATTSDSTKSLISDLYAAFARSHPFLLDWPDHRPIGSLIIATTAAGWPGNPRGWLLDKTLDVRTIRGRDEFRDRLMGWADRSVVELQKMHAQGMITWDIEGEQFPQQTTYIGDPRELEKLAPEMAPLADEYFQRFRNAGLRVGICVRPQQLVLSPDGRSARQVESPDPAKTLIDKITYARNRWGATLFYIDSNGDPNRPYPVAVFEKVAQAVPNVLLIPEHHNLSYYASTAPYMELRQDRPQTPPEARDIIPEAFSVINIADGDVVGKRKLLLEGVKHGDILLFRGWYDDPLNEKIRDLAAAGQQ